MKRSKRSRQQWKNHKGTVFDIDRSSKDHKEIHGIQGQFNDHKIIALYRSILREKLKKDLKEEARFLFLIFISLLIMILVK